MPLMSRFRKDEKGDDDPLADMTGAEQEEEEGLFMPTNPKPAPADPLEGLSAQAGGGEPDELLEASLPESPLADDAAPSAEGEDDPGGGSVAVESGGPVVRTVSAEEEGSGQSGDDPLSLFRAAAAESNIGGLTKEIDDIPVEELLTDLRELRAMLVSRQESVDNESE